MKNLLLALALLVLAPLTARAQPSYEAYKANIARGATEDQARRDREAEAARYRRTAPTAPPLTNAQSRYNRSENRAERADQKAHGGTIAFPGGYRGIKGGGGIITPEGKVLGGNERKNQKYLQKHPMAKPAGTAGKTRQKTPPQPARAAPSSPRQIDSNNSLGKLQEFNRQAEARRKAAAKPTN